MLERVKTSYTFLMKSGRIFLPMVNSTISTSIIKSTGIAKSNKRKLQIEKAVLFGSVIVGSCETVLFFFILFFILNNHTFHIGIFNFFLYTQKALFYFYRKKGPYEEHRSLAARVLYFPAISRTSPLQCIGSTLLSAPRRPDCHGPYTTSRHCRHSLYKGF